MFHIVLNKALKKFKIFDDFWKKIEKKGFFVIIIFYCYVLLLVESGRKIKL